MGSLKKIFFHIHKGREEAYTLAMTVTSKCIISITNGVIRFISTSVTATWSNEQHHSKHRTCEGTLLKTTPHRSALSSSLLDVTDCICHEGTKFCSLRSHYRPQTKFGQGNMFTGVCLSTGGCGLVGGGAWSRGCLIWGVSGPWGGVCSWGALVRGVPGLGGLPGPEVPGWGMPRPGGSALEGASWRPPDGYCCGHPTGMHSCWDMNPSKEERHALIQAPV